MRGPSIFGLGSERLQLASDAALGLKPFSLGPTNEYLEGWSYMKGCELPLILNGRGFQNEADVC